MGDDRRNILKELIRRGWRVVQGKHHKCYAPDKKNIVVISGTGSSANARTLKNILADIRRVDPTFAC